jgi:hypothetical protein
MVKSSARPVSSTFIGQFDEALAHREWARPFEAKAEGSAIGS